MHVDQPEDKMAEVVKQLPVKSFQAWTALI